MERTLDDIASAALQLTLESRAELAKRLLDSLDDLAPEEAQRLWADEAARRYRELKDGTATGVPAEQVFSKLEAQLRR